MTRTASTDGSTILTYAADSHELYGELTHTPPGLHPEGSMRDVVEWDTGKFLGRIRQAPVTYAVVGNMNEHQLTIGETTFGGRPELNGPAGIVFSLVVVAIAAWNLVLDFGMVEAAVAARAPKAAEWYCAFGIVLTLVWLYLELLRLLGKTRR